SRPEVAPDGPLWGFCLFVVVLLFCVCVVLFFVWRESVCVKPDRGLVFFVCGASLTCLPGVVVKTPAKERYKHRLNVARNWSEGRYVGRSVVLTPEEPYASLIGGCRLVPGTSWVVF